MDGINKNLHKIIKIEKNEQLRIYSIWLKKGLNNRL